MMHNKIVFTFFSSKKLGLISRNCQRLLVSWFTQRVGMLSSRSLFYQHDQCILLYTRPSNWNPYSFTQFFEQRVPELQKYFPAYMGECGRMIVVAEGGNPLSDYRNASWDIRVDLSRQILQMIYDFQHASPDWMVIFDDFRYDNFAVTDDRRIQLIDLGDISVIDKREMLPRKFRQVMNAEMAIWIECKKSLFYAIFLFFQENMLFLFFKAWYQRDWFNFNNLHAL